MSDSRGDDADIPAYPGQDRPADPGAEAMTTDDTEGSPEAAPPSEQRGEG